MVIFAFEGRFGNITQNKYQNTQSSYIILSENTEINIEYLTCPVHG